MRMTEYIEMETGAIQQYAITGELESIEQARELLEVADSPQEVKRVADFAEAMRVVYAKAKLGLEAQNEAAEMKIHAQIKGGEMLASLVQRGGYTHGEANGGGHRLTLGDIGVSEWESKTWQRLASASPDTIQAKIDETRTAGYELTTAAILKYIGHHGTLGTGENEWYTPEDVLDDVRLVLGTIELDPASCEIAQEVVGAENYFTQEDDALTKDWFGKVFLNPPYSQPDIDYFASKMAAEVKAKRVPEAIMLTNNYTDTRWFDTALAEAQLICFTTGRIVFVSQREKPPAPIQGQAFFYYGENLDRFADVFEKRGNILPARFRGEL